MRVEERPYHLDYQISSAVGGIPQTSISQHMRVLNDGKWSRLQAVHFDAAEGWMLARLSAGCWMLDAGCYMLHATCLPSEVKSGIWE